MAATSDMTSMVPGFDFLQGLFKTASAGLPAVGQWVAPTLDPAELDKRIQDLKTVQFWLEQNARVLATSIQALEVQRMTLTTLQTLNLPLSELTEALRIKLPQATDAAPAPAPPPAPPPAPAPAPAPTPAPAPAAEATPSQPVPAVDPMLWWGALTQQFADLAAKAVNDGSQALAAATPAPTVTTSPPKARRAVDAGAEGQAVAESRSTDRSTRSASGKTSSTKAAATRSAPRKAAARPGPR